jgi:aspartate aminotransferase
MTAPPPLARRLGTIEESATVAITDRARSLRAQGRDVLSFSVGEPDFEPPEHVKEAATRAIRDGRATRYTAARGIPELREAIAADSARRRGGVRHTIDEIVVSVGGKHALFNLALSLYEPGDEVIIPAPYWVSYPDQVRLAGAEPVIVATTAASGLRLTPEALSAAITPRTKALLLCSPSNPTGSAYSAAELRALADVMAPHGFWIVVDEIYARLVYGGFEQRSLLEVAPELRDRIVVIDGVSKSFAMTGYRIGWMLCPAHVARACEKIQAQATTNAAAVSQWAAEAALRGGDEPVERMCRAFEARRDRVLEQLRGIEGLRCPTPEGAFYVFPDVRAFFGRYAGGRVVSDDVALCEYLLDEAGCALVPGAAFGAPGHVRMSYAASTESLDEGLARIRAALGKLA